MLPFNLEKGMTTSSWYAELALRIRVRKSAIGSVMDMSVVPFSPGSPARFAGPDRRGPVTNQCGSSG